MKAKRNGMHVSLADITIAHLAVFGVKHPDNQPYAEAARLVREARPADWHKVFAWALEERVNHAGQTYEQVAEVLKARIRVWVVKQGSSTGRIHARDYDAAIERAAAIGFKQPDSIVLQEGA